MKNRTLVGLAASLVASAGAFAQTSGCDIVIINRGFEDPVLADNNFSYSIPGWVVVGDAGSFNPGAGTYPGGNVPGGNNVGYVSCCAGGRTPGVTQQTLPAFLTAQTTYDLSLLVGQRLETPWSDFRLQLLAGSTPVIDTVVSTPPTSGTFAGRTFQFVCPPGHPAIGGRLQIRMTHQGAIENQANYDEFRLVATPNCVSICVQPEPIRTCLAVTAQFSAEHAGIGPFTYRWFKNSVALQDGTTAWGSLVSGADSTNLSISNLRTDDDGSYQLVVTNGCGSIGTDSVALLVCPSDFNCDGVTEFFDYLDFVDAFSQNAIAADFNEDGVVDFFDYLDFVDRFATGC